MNPLHEDQNVPSLSFKYDFQTVRDSIVHVVKDWLVVNNISIHFTWINDWYDPFRWKRACTCWSRGPTAAEKALCSGSSAVYGPSTVAGFTNLLLNICSTSLRGTHTNTQYHILYILIFYSGEGYWNNCKVWYRWTLHVILSIVIGPVYMCVCVCKSWVGVDKEKWEL